MSNRGPLRLSASLELLADLQRTVTDFAKKEELLTRDLLARRGSVNRKLRDATEKTEARLASGLAEAETYFQAEQERREATYSERRSRLERAAAAGLRSAPRRAQEARERWMGDLQRRKFRAERTLATEREAAAKTLANFSATLAENQAGLRQLERQIRRAFRGYRPFLRLLQNAAPASATDEPSRDAQMPPERRLEELQAQIEATASELAAFRRFVVVRTFSDFSLPLLVPPVLILGGVIVVLLGGLPNAYAIGAGVVVVLLAVAWMFHRYGLRQALPAATALVATLARAQEIEQTSTAAAQARHEQQRARAEENFEQTRAEIEAQWVRSDEVAADFEKASRAKIGAQAPRVVETIERVRTRRLEALAAQREEQLEIWRGDAAAKQQTFQEVFAAESAQLAAEEAARWQELERAWKDDVTPLFDRLAAINSAADELAPGWESRLPETWNPPAVAPASTRFAHLDLVLGPLPKDPRLALPGPAQRFRAARAHVSRSRARCFLRRATPATRR